MKYVCLLSIIFIFLTISVTGQEIQKLKKCPECQYWESRLDAKFCSQCGKALIESEAIIIVQCPSENRILESNARFCPFCGKPTKIIYQEIPKLGQENHLPTIGRSSLPSQPPQIRTSQDSNSVKNTKVSSNTDQNTKKHKITWDCLPEGMQEIEKQIIDEGLRRTSQERQVVRILAYGGKTNNIENFYSELAKSYQKNAHLSIIRSNDPVCQTPLLMLKFVSTNQNIKLEVCYYTYTEDLLEQMQSKQKIIQQQLDTEMESLQPISKEIKDLRSIQQSQPNFDIEMRINDLQKRYLVASNSNTYWQLKAKQEMIARRASILLVTITNKK